MNGESIEQTIARIEADFALFSDWEERYAHVLDLAKGLTPLSEAERSEANRVRGCASRVWLISETRPEAPGKLFFRGESDALLVQGLIALMLDIFSGRTPTEILSVDPKTLFERLQLKDALTQQRSNGLFSMIERIRRDAASAAQ